MWHVFDEEEHDFSYSPSMFAVGSHVKFLRELRSNEIIVVLKRVRVRQLRDVYYVVLTRDGELGEVNEGFFDGVRMKRL